jgi:DNA-binding CsgD family transcriptional regulator
LITLTESKYSSINQKSDSLSEKETAVFVAMRDGLSSAEIVNELKISNSYVRKTKSQIRKKMVKELKKAADILRLQFTDADIDRDSGLLKCFDWVHNAWVTLVFTAFKGILAYYEHDCTSNCEVNCLKTLDLIGDERNVAIDEKIKSLSTRDQYEYLFENIRKKGREL